MKKLLCGAVALALFGHAFSQQETSGTTNFKVKVPEIIVLYHWSEAQLDFSNFKNHVADTAVHKATGDVNSASVDITGAGAPVVKFSTVPSAMSGTFTVTLKDSWAVRAISAKPIKLALAVQDSNLVHSGGGSTATITNGVLASAASGVTLSGTPVGTSADISSGWTQKVGSITFNLDLSNVTKAGLHESAQETFKLTLSTQ